MKTIDVLVDVDVAIFAVLNFHIDSFTEVAFVFYRDTLVQECDMVGFWIKCIRTKCLVTTTQTIF